MTRRDTIIVAALMNAGLLVILFVSALKNEERKEEPLVKTEVSYPTANPMPFASEAKRIMGDEVDLVLKQYAQQDPLQTAPSAVDVASSPAFAEEIKISPVPQISPSVPILTDAKEASEPTYLEIKVKKGDVLEKIARQNRSTVSEIMKCNHLTSTQLKIGQVLKIPVHKALVEKAPLDPTSAKYYTVKPGDNPWTIAVKNHMKVEELLQLNNMDETKARKLKPGDQIRIR